MRVGIFGGSFDPVHQGHLLLAEQCREQCHLAKVLFVPAAVSPHKQGAPPASDQARFDMLQLAIGGHAAFEMCSLELERGGISYTVDTLEALHGSRPGDELILLIGADTLADFPNWHRPDRVCELALLAVVRRPGSLPVSWDVVRPLASPTRWMEMQQLHVEMPLIDLSSSQIRQRVMAGRSIRYMVPRGVETYIEAQGLYRSGTS